MDHDQQVARALLHWRRRYLSDDLQVKETTRYLSYDLEEKFAESRRNGHPVVYLILGVFCATLVLFAWLSDRYITSQSNKLDLTLSDYQGVPLGELLRTLDRLGKAKARLVAVNGELGALREQEKAAKQAVPPAARELAQIQAQIAPVETQRIELAKTIEALKRELGSELDRARAAALPMPAPGRETIDRERRSDEKRFAAPSRALEQQGQRLRDDSEERIRLLLAIQKRLTDDLEVLRRERAAEREAFQVERDRFATDLSNAEALRQSELDARDARARAEIELRETRIATLAGEGREMRSRIAELEAVLAARDGRIRELEKAAAQGGERLKQLEGASSQLAWYRRYVDILLRSRSEGATVIESENPQSILVQVSGLYEVAEGSTGSVFHGESDYVGTVVFFRADGGLRARLTSSPEGGKVRPMDRIVIHLR